MGTFVEKIQGDIKERCEKLEEYGYESLVIMVSKDNDDPYITGSQKGTDFLDLRNLLISEFTQFCIGVRVSAESHKDSKKLKTNKENSKPAFGNKVETDNSLIGSSYQEREPIFDDGDETDDYDDTDFTILQSVTVIDESQKSDIETIKEISHRTANKLKNSSKKISVKRNEKTNSLPKVRVVLKRLSKDKSKAESKASPTAPTGGSQDEILVKDNALGQVLETDDQFRSKKKIKYNEDSEQDENNDCTDIKVFANDSGDDADNIECHFCLKVFSTQENLETHLESRHVTNRKDIKCPHCCKPCESSICLGDHLAKEHDNCPGTVKENYRCGHCKFVFSYRTHLVEHNQRNSNCKEMAEQLKMSNEIKDNILKSEILYEDKNTGETYRKTAKELMNPAIPNTCEICLKSFDRAYSFRRHIFQHVQTKLFQCNICLFEFNMEEAMKRHWKLHDTKPYYCCNCFERYETKSRLNYHTSYSCKMIMEKPDLQCPTCGQQTNSMSALENHKLSCSGIKSWTCETCGKQLTSSTSLSRHRETYHSNHDPYECKECGKTYSRKDSLKRHMQYHGEKKFQCSICDYAAVEASSIQKHQQVHTGERPFICDFCGIAYSRKPTLDNHRRLHTGERPFKCDFEGCEKAFRNPENLRQHKCYHSSNYAYVCDFCGRKFKVRSAYKHHRLYHTVEYRWPCEYCDEKFRTRMTHKTHIIKKHSDKIEEVERNAKVKFYRCDTCPKLFSTPEHLQEHNNVHLGIKPVKCRHCGKGFSSKGNMLQHEKSHVGGKKYRCSLCPKSYSMPETFQQHLENKHNQTVKTDDLSQFEGPPETDRSIAPTQYRVTKTKFQPPDLVKDSLPSQTQMDTENYEATAFIPPIFSHTIIGEAFKVTSDY